MQVAPIRVYELKKHWKAVEALAEGESVESIRPGRMPPWNEICSELGWEKHLLTDGHFSNKSHGYCGAYRLVGLTSENDLKTPVTLNRVCGQDVTGTLYIGEAGSLHERLNQIRLSTHDGVKMLNSYSPLKIPLNRLAIALLFTGRSHRSVEGDLNHAYIKSFGELPPLNHRI
jgi:hypothetical protein